MLGEGDREADRKVTRRLARVAPRRAALAVGAVVGAVLLAAFVAAGDQVPLATEGERRVGLFELPTIPDPGATPTEPAPLEQRQQDEISGIGTLGVLLQAGLILVAAVVFVISIRTVRTWQRTKPDRRAIIPDPPMAPIPDELVDAIDEGIEAHGERPGRRRHRRVLGPPRGGGRPRRCRAGRLRDALRAGRPRARRAPRAARRRRGAARALPNRALLTPSPRRARPDGRARRAPRSIRAAIVGSPA